MRWLWVVAVTGCNQIYSLEPTVLLDGDRDDDGLLDVIDNCVDDANPLQENLDGDELGDVCDPCPTGSNHNEDGDPFLDGCDNCPHTSNEDQANSDGDELGDACDRDPRAQRRVWFDGFVDIRPQWIPGVADWVIDMDAVRPVVVPDATDPGLWDRRSEAGGASYFIEVVMEIDDVLDARHGIWSRLRIGETEFQCVLTHTASGWSMIAAWQLVATEIPLTTPPQNPVMLRMRRDGTLVHCETGLDRASIDVVDPVTFPGLHTAGALTRFLSIDIVTSD